jgi:hypothetical protein
MVAEPITSRICLFSYLSPHFAVGGSIRSYACRICTTFVSRRPMGIVNQDLDADACPCRCTWRPPGLNETLRTARTASQSLQLQTLISSSIFNRFNSEKFIEICKVQIIIAPFGYNSFQAAECGNPLRFTGFISRGPSCAQSFQPRRTILTK